MPTENIKSLPKNIRLNQELIQEAIRLGCAKAKVILTKTISIAHWVKLQCQYGCSHYGSVLTCPPFTPDAGEMSEVLVEYEKALHINAGPEKNIREIVVQLEKLLKEKGFNKALVDAQKKCNDLGIVARV